MGKNNNTVKKTKQLETEDNNKKIIIIALLFALVIGGLTYWQLSKEDTSNKELNNNNDQILEEEIGVEKEEEKEEVDKYKPVYIPNKIVKVEKEEEIVEEKFYSLEFETNGGSIIEKQILSENEKTENVLSIREGWSFAGWYVDQELTEEFIFGRALTEDTILYAKWAKFIIFKVNDVQFGDISVVYENEVIDLLDKEDLGELIEDEYEVAWVLNTYDEEENVVSTEVEEGTILNDENIIVESDTIELNLKKLSKFDVEFYLSSNEELPIHVQEVVESRPIDFTEVEQIISEQQIDEEYSWYYIDENQIKWNFFKEQKASIDITKLYLDGVYTITYTKDEIDFEEDVIIDDIPTTEDIEQETIFNEEINNTTEEIIDENNSSNDDIVIEENNNIIKQIKVAKDTRITNENILVPEKVEGYNFVGWFLVDDILGVTDIKLTEDMVIDSDKTFVARWEKIEEEVEILEIFDIEVV